MGLETVDLVGVEILATGGPFHGRGSPPAGDYWRPADLRELVDAHRELAAELRPPATIGHGGGHMPAVGYLDRLRLSADGSELLADVRDVPRQFAELVKARAYRTRSVELSRVTSQRTGRKYARVVTGLAWLGGKMPAVRTLGDVTALYDGAAAPARVYEFSTDGGSTMAQEQADTRRRLEETKRELATVKKEIEQRDCDRLLDGAIEDGRIRRSERAGWAKRYEMAPLLTAELVADLPAQGRQIVYSAADLTEEEDAAERAYLSTRLGIAKDEVV